MNFAFEEVDHVGISVIDMDESIKFYQEILGLKLIFQIELSSKFLEKSLNVPGARLKYAFLKAGNVHFGLVQNINPVGKPYDATMYDIGIRHLSFRVADIQKTYIELQKKGIQFNSPPVQIDEGPQKGSYYCFFTDPNGIALEIFQY